MWAGMWDGRWYSGDGSFKSREAIVAVAADVLLDDHVFTKQGREHVVVDQFIFISRHASQEVLNILTKLAQYD